MINEEIKLSFYRALLFQVLPITRAIYLFRVAENLLELRVYNDRALSEEEQDAYYSVAAEMGGDFVELRVQTQFLVDTQPLHQQAEDGLLVYARYEYLVFKHEEHS